MFACLPAKDESFHAASLTSEMDVWAHVFRSAGHHTVPITPGPMLLVVVAGEFIFHSERRGARFVRAGQLVVLDTVDRASCTYRAPEGSAGLAFGVSLRRAPSDQDDLVFDGEPLDDPALAATAEAWIRQLVAGATLDAQAITAAVRDVVARASEVVPRDALGDAKREIDRHFTTSLYVSHFAEIACAGPVRFSRAFARRYRVTPVRYRLLRRVYEAARLNVLYPERSIQSIAIDAGFLDFRFFRRCFRSVFHVGALELREAHAAQNKVAAAA